MFETEVKAEERKKSRRQRVPVEKQRERENAGERWALEAEEILSALAVEEAHTLKAMLSCRLSVRVFLVLSNAKGK